jgi:predicted double-glycine peptidase
MLRKIADSMQDIKIPKKRNVTPIATTLALDPADGNGIIGSVEGSTIPLTMIRFPTMRQAFSYDCGAAVASTLMHFYGYDLREKEVMDQMHVTKAGTGIDHMVNFFKKYGFNVKAGPDTIESIKKNIDQCIPVIVNLQAYPDKKTGDWKKGTGNGHFVIAIGYTEKHLLFSDPSNIYDTYLTYEELEKRWHDTDIDGTYLDHFTVVPLGKEPVYDSDRILPMG